MVHLQYVQKNLQSNLAKNGARLHCHPGVQVHGSQGHRGGALPRQRALLRVIVLARLTSGHSRREEIERGGSGNRH